MLTSTTKELRAKHYDDLINIYYNNLAGIIRDCGSDPEKLFSFSDLQSQLKQFGIYGVMMAPMLLQIMVSDSKDLMNLEGWAENGQIEASICNLNELSEKMFKEAITDALDDAKQYGWFK